MQAVHDDGGGGEVWWERLGEAKQAVDLVERRPSVG